MEKGDKKGGKRGGGKRGGGKGERPSRGQSIISPKRCTTAAETRREEEQRNICITEKTNGKRKSRKKGKKGKRNKSDQWTDND